MDSPQCTATNLVAFYDIYGGKKSNSKSDNTQGTIHTYNSLVFIIITPRNTYLKILKSVKVGSTGVRRKSK